MGCKKQGAKNGESVKKITVKKLLVYISVK